MLNKNTFAAEILDYVKDRIVSGQYRPGERIDQKAIANELSVSQTPVREAMQKLAELGLVISKPYVGYFVVKLTSDDVRVLFALRTAIESLALEYGFKRLVPEKLKELLGLHQELAGPHITKTKLLEKEPELDQALHRKLILESVGNKWLARYMQGISDLVKLTTVLSDNPRAAIVEHIEILEALLNRDLGAATTALKHHLKRAEDEAVLLSEGGDE